MKPALRNLVIVAGIIVVTFVVVLALARRHQLTQHSPAPSTFNASPQGWKAIYTTLDKLEWPVQRWQHPWTKLGARRGVLVFGHVALEETYLRQRAHAPSQAECEALAQWIARGNALLLFANPDSPFPLSALYDQLGLRVASHYGRIQREPVTLPSVMPATFTRGVRQLRIARNTGLDAGGSHVPLVAGSGDRVHALWVRHGEGHALVFSTPSFIDNEFVAQHDNLALLLNLLTGYETVFFDEFHHGYSREFAAHDFLRLPMVKFAAAQLALLIGLLIFSQWRRFGEPVALARETRRSVMEYAVSLGDLYARAETQLEALDYLHKNLRQEFGDRLDPALQAEIEGHLQSGRLTRWQFAQLARKIQQFRRQQR